MFVFVPEVCTVHAVYIETILIWPQENGWSWSLSDTVVCSLPPSR